MDSLNCVSSCTGNLGAEFKTSIDKEKCLYPFESCGDAKYFADSSTTYFCTKCDTIITNCEECSSSTICTKCDAGSILIYNTDGSVTCEAACARVLYKLDNTGWKLHYQIVLHPIRVLTLSRILQELLVLILAEMVIIFSYNNFNYFI